MPTNMRSFRTRNATHGLEQADCTDCGRINDPSATACYHCGGTSFEDVTLSREGEIVTVVVQHFLPEEFDTPLALAIVETPEGGKILGMFTEVEEPHEIAIGESVDIERKRFDRKDGETLYELKFRRRSGGK